MSSRKEKKPASGGKKQAEDQQREQLLQAVVLADSFDSRFRPLTLEVPRCLLPLANTPIIEYTLEFLASSGVEDVFIFTSVHGKQIDEYIRSSKWNAPSSPFKKCQIIVSPSSVSVGDAMRDLDAKQLLTTDFLLINGDFVGNLPLENVLALHRKRRTADKNAIMTMVLREAGSVHRTKPRGETGVFVIDATNNRCVHYDEVRPSEKHGILIPPDLIKSYSELQIRNDLIDCNVDICSPDVPALFTENFDYQHIRRNFLHGILTDYELYGKMIYTHIVNDHYAARIRSLQTYDAVSKDIMGRWTFPFCPDSNLETGKTFGYERGNIYKEKNVSLASSTMIRPMTVIGTGTSMGKGCVVGGSTFGTNCNIGERVIVHNSYIWDSVVIGDGCQIKNAIIAAGATLGKNCVIEPGAVISWGVKLADGTIVRENKRITSFKEKKDLNDSEDELQTDLSLVGNGGMGYEYEDSDFEDDDDQDAASQEGLSLVYKMTHLNVSDSSISTISGDSEDELVSKKNPSQRERTDSMMTVNSEDSNQPDSWHKEAYASILTAIECDHPVEVASLELNSLRMTSNASWGQVRRAAISAFLTRVEHLTGEQNPKSMAQAVEVVFTRWKPLVMRMIFERADQVDFLLRLQKACAAKPEIGGVMLLNVTQRLYQLDIVEEEAINTWWKHEKSTTNVGGMASVRAGTAPFVKWLAEAEEEGSTENEEGSTDEESDDE